MNRSVFVCAVGLSLSLDYAAGAVRQYPDYGGLPLAFEENCGQAGASVQFVGRGSRYSVFITDRNAILSLTNGSESVALSMRVIGARRVLSAQPEDRLPGYSNYFIGTDPAKWRRGVRRFGSVRVAGIRKGVDLIYHGKGPDLEYDLDVAPGASPNLRLRFQGASGLSLDANGDLLIHTASGDLRQRSPVAWQGSGVSRRAVRVSQVIRNRTDVTLRVANYDRRLPLKIDPVVVYSTYLGGSGQDRVNGIAVDASGNAYVTGNTTSLDFPVTDGSHLSGSSDMFVAKLNASGTALIYASYIGGANLDSGAAIAVDSSGNAFITGDTTSSNFPIVPVGSSSNSGGQTTIVTALNASGVITASRYLGGFTGSAIALDSGGNPYVAGNTDFEQFPVTSGALITTKPTTMNTGFVAKLTPSLAITYATYLGGTYSDSIAAIAVDASGDAFVAGTAQSANFPTTSGAFQTTYAGSADAFVAELNPQGSALVYSTFLGGSSGDFAVALALDSSGSAYVAGTTQSADFPTKAGSFLTSRTSYGYQTSFVTKINPGGGTLAYSTYLGGSNTDTAVALAVDAAGNSYVLGTAGSYDFPTTPGAIKTQRDFPSCCSTDFTDVFLAEFNSTGSSLLYSTYLGTSSSDTAAAIALDANLGVYVAGATSSMTYATTPSALQASNRGNGINVTGFLAKIDFSSPAVCNIVLSSNSGNFPGRGATGSFTFTVADGCPWEITNDSVVSLNGPRSGFGGGTVNFTVTLNPYTYQTRTGTIRLNGGVLSAGTNVFTVNQAVGSCTDPVLSPASLSFDQAGGIQNTSVGLPGGCNWNLANLPPWIIPSNNVNSNGSGNLSLYATPNSFSARMATITLATKTLTVSQAGGSCTLSLNSSSVTVPPQATPGSVAFTTSGSNCTWQAGPSVPWIQIGANSASGQGSGSISYVVAANPGVAPRTGSVLIGDQTFQITQSGGPSYIPLSYTEATYTSGAVGFSGDGGPVSAAEVNGPRQMAFDTAGNFYFADVANFRIRKVDVNGIITTIAGGNNNVLGDGGPATSGYLQIPNGVAVSNSGTVYIADTADNRIRKVTNNIIQTIAGTGVVGYNGDNQAATAALIDGPASVAVDTAGNVYFTDTGNNRIRKITPGGLISTVAGNGVSGFSGDGGPATSAQLHSPASLAIDPAGNLLFLDFNYVRKISTSGIITTVAGRGNSSGNGVPANSVSLLSPLSLTVDASGSIFIGGFGGAIQKITPDGLIWNIDTSYLYGRGVSGLGVDRNGNLYVGTTGSIYKMTPSPIFCQYSVSPAQSQPATGGNLTITVTATTSSCSWTSSSTVPWITLQTGSGSGNGSANFTIARNSSSAPRSGLITVAGQMISIFQAAAVAPDFAGSGEAGVFLYDPLSGNAYTGLSSGTGTFNYIYMPATPGFDIVRYGDVNGDGKTDLILYNSSNALGYTLLSNGDGTYNPVSLFWGPGFKTVAAGDLNGDGKTDFLIYRATDGASYTALSNGDGTFSYKYTLVSPGFTHMAVADFNGDGKADVFYYNSGTGAANLGTSDGTGGFTFSPVALESGYNFVETGDINADGQSDLVVYSAASGVSKIGLSNSVGFSFTTNNWSPGFTAVKVFDFNGDGKGDLALYNKDNTLGYLLVGDGAGNFTAYSLFWGQGYDNVMTLDVDGDGKQDVIIYNSANGASYTGISTGASMTNPFTYQYAYWGNGKQFAGASAQR